MPASDATRPWPSHTEERARWVQTAVDAGLPLHDDILMRHVDDCRALMEAAHARFLTSRTPEDDAERRRWAQRRDTAVAKLSPAFLAAWHARVDAQIGVGYFIDQGDAARAQVASNDAEGRD